MKTKNYFLLILLVFISNNIFSQVKEQEIISKTKKGIPKLIRFNETKVSSNEIEINKFLKKQYKADVNTEFKTSKNTNKETNGLISQKYNQYYKNIKVEFARINTISKKGLLHLVNSTYIDIKGLNTTPYINKNTAIEYAKSYINAQKYMWENEENEIFIKQLKKDNKATYLPKAELVIIREDVLNESSKPALAYKIKICAEIPYSKDYVYVNASTGKIIYKSSLLSHVEGTAETRYSGTRNIETEQIGSEFRLRDYSRGNGIETFNMNNSSNYSNVTDFIDNDNIWTSDEYNNSNRDNAALDLHWGAEMTYDYFFQRHNNFSSFDGQGMTIKAYANWSNLNAQWDASEEVIRFGSGNSTIFNALTSLDVVAHEYGHGIDHFSSQLEYINESGALDEGIADIWGAMVEHFAAPEKNTYLIGEEITLSRDALRSMSNPKIFENPDTYLGDFWQSGTADFGGVHTNSGVMGHWFYLLAEGSSETDEINDNGDNFSFSGIGADKAANIIFHAQQNYFVDSFMGYADARLLTIQAAEDLYGEGSIEAATTCQSWFAVGVGNNNCNVNIKLTGNSTICSTSNYTYTLDYLPQNAVTSWSVASNIQIVNSNNSSITIKAINNSINESSRITAIIGNTTIQKKIWIGKPKITLTEKQYDTRVNVSLKLSDPIITSSSTLTHWAIIKTKGTGRMYLSNSNTSFSEVAFGNDYDWYVDIIVSATNGCGTSFIQRRINPIAPYVEECDDFIFDGNTISLPPDCENSTPEMLTSENSNSSIDKIFIYDTLGRLINSYTGNSNINLEKLNSGVYIFKVQLNSGKIITKKILK